MPYLLKDRKNQIDNGASLRTPGDLTYSLTRIMQDVDEPVDSELEHAIKDYLSGKPERFEHYASVLGCLCAALFEFDRRLKYKPYKERLVAKRLDDVADFMQAYYNTYVGPYEDKKCEENGDVYA